MAHQESDEVGSQNEEEVSLSENTLAILSEFLEEQQKAKEAVGADPFPEVWGMSQFWYTDETAERLAAECVRAADGGAIACIACPSLFRKLLKSFPEQHCHLFEFDTRFEVLGNFSFYDYNHPLHIDEELHNKFRVIVIDPPYLSRECFEKCVQSMIYLGVPSSPCFFALTGASMREAAKEIIGLRPVQWRPEHKSKLGNDFCLYVREQASAERFGGWDAL